MENIININVSGQFISKSGKNAGGAGSGNSTVLKITFGSEWDAFAKRIIWRDARGENETSVLLSAGLTDKAYTTVIPPEAVKYTGWCSFTIEGYYSGFPQRAVRSISDKLFVAYAEGAEECAELTPPESMQLHEEFEQLLPSVKTLMESTEKKIDKELEQNSVWEDFSDEKLYYPGNKVFYGGSSYLCRKETIGTAPGDADCWQLIVSRGERGLIGLQGPRGIRGDKGDTGAKGDKGDTGEKGDKGDKGDAGERGLSGTVVPANGFYSFSVDESGDLIVYYPDAEAKPQAELDENGELLLEVGGNSYNMGSVKGDKLTFADLSEENKSELMNGVKDRLGVRGSAESLTASLTTTDALADEQPIKLCVYGSKNMIRYPYAAATATKTVNGITFTDNGDGTITASGTATADAVFEIPAFTVEAKVQYFLSGCPAGGSLSTYYFQMRGFTQDTGRGAKIKSSYGFTNTFEIVIKEGTAADSLVFKPQLEEGTAATEYEAGTGIGDLNSGSYTIPVKITGGGAEKKTVTAISDKPLFGGEYIDLVSKTRKGSSGTVGVTVSGDISLYDENTITCETAAAPVKLEITYYRDINKVITNLTNAILSQGGNV